jgi:hypothetical protein
MGICRVNWYAIQEMALQRRIAGSEDRIPPLLYLKIQSLLCVRIAGALSELTLNGHQRRIRCSAGIDTRNQSSCFHLVAFVLLLLHKQ